MISEKMIVDKINRLVLENDFKTAKKYIDSNSKIFSRGENYNALSDDAKIIYKNSIEQPLEHTLSQLEALVLSDVNKHALNFDIPMLRTLLKNHENIILNPKSRPYLNESAVTVLKMMGYEVEDKKQDNLK